MGLESDMAPGPDQDVKTVGEIGRSVDRIEATVNNLALQVQAVVALTTAHSVKLDVETRRGDELEKKIDTLIARSAYISGGIAALAGIANYVFGKH